MSIKNSNDTIGNRTRNLPACSAVPQPTALQSITKVANTIVLLSSAGRPSYKVHLVPEDGNSVTYNHMSAERERERETRLSYFNDAVLIAYCEVRR
jgi:hypothetical protein